MGEAILLALWAGTSLFFICREIKTKDDRESHEWWLSEVKDCISSIEGEFRCNCKKITEEEFTRQRFDYYKYSGRISELEEKYKNELTEKVIAKKRVTVRTVPEHLAREYERNISDIAYTFRFFARLIRDNDFRKE